MKTGMFIFVIITSIFAQYGVDLDTVTQAGLIKMLNKKEQSYHFKSRDKIFSLLITKYNNRITTGYYLDEIGSLIAKSKFAYINELCSIANGVDSLSGPEQTKCAKVYQYLIGKHNSIKEKYNYKSGSNLNSFCSKLTKTA